MKKWIIRIEPILRSSLMRNKFLSIQFNDLNDETPYPLLLNSLRLIGVYPLLLKINRSCLHFDKLGGLKV